MPEFEPAFLDPSVKGRSDQVTRHDQHEEPEPPVSLGEERNPENVGNEFNGLELLYKVLPAEKRPHYHKVTGKDPHEPTLIELSCMRVIVQGEEDAHAGEKHEEFHPYLPVPCQLEEDVGVPSHEAMLQHYKQDANSHQLPTTLADYAQVNLHLRTFQWHPRHFSVECCLFP